MGCSPGLDLQTATLLGRGLSPLCTGGRSLLEDRFSDSVTVLHDHPAALGMDVSSRPVRASTVRATFGAVVAPAQRAQQAPSAGGSHRNVDPGGVHGRVGAKTPWPGPSGIADELRYHPATISEVAPRRRLPPERTGRTER